MIPEEQEELVGIEGWRKRKRAFLRYCDALGKDPEKCECIGLAVLYGYPPGVEEMGGPIAVYEECVRRGITWEELLDYKDPWKENHKEQEELVGIGGWRKMEKAFLRYCDALGKDPEECERIGLMVPSGYPPGVKEMGGPIAVYEECVRRGITWEELLDYKDPWKENHSIIY